MIATISLYGLVSVSESVSESVSVNFSAIYLVLKVLKETGISSFLFESTGWSPSCTHM